MVIGPEILLLILVLAAVLGASTLIKTVRPFIVNAVVGLLVLFLANALFGVSVALTPIGFAIVAIGGIPGALLVIFLSLFGIAFA